MLIRPQLLNAAAFAHAILVASPAASFISPSSPIPQISQIISVSSTRPRLYMATGHEKHPNSDKRNVKTREIDNHQINRRIFVSSVIPILHFNTPPSYALTPPSASTDYDTYSGTYDVLDGGVAATNLGIADARSRVLSLASGKVLEIGAGTGLNLPFYTEKMTSLTLLDISSGMLSRAREKASGDNISFVIGDATSELVKQFGSGTFDTVVDTFSLCVMGNEGALKCLQEMKEVVKPEREGGRILLIENSKSSNPFLGWYQDLTAEAAATAGGKGCLYNQDVGALIRRAGLKIVNEDEFAVGIFRSFICVKE